MFERLFQTAKKREESLEEERLAVENGIEDVRIALTAVAPPDDESHYAERGLAAGFDSFEEIYRRAMGEKSRDRYSVLTVVGMMDSAHLAGMSVESKRSSVMMALEAAGVPPSQILQDAMVRQSALDDYVDTQEKKLRAFESAMNDANRNMQAELERITVSYKAEIRANAEEVAKEQDAFREWQAGKRRESESLAAASAVFTESGGTYRFSMGVESHMRR